MEMFRIKELSFQYPMSEKKALDGIDLTISEGEFILLCGQSGCGKSTLLRQLKREITPHGKTEGEIFYYGKPLKDWEGIKSASEIGFVFQNPDNQIVTDKVWHELAFGLESLGLPTQIIRRRVAEISGFLGISQWFRKDVTELSGGQKQMLNLAAVMVMQPKILILDEPTSQLDPIAATEFLETLKKINHDLGITILLTEHRLEDAFSVADRVIVMHKSKIVCDATPHTVLDKLSEAKEYYPITKGFPSAMRIYKQLGGIGQCPITVKQGREWLNSQINGVGEVPYYKRSSDKPFGKPCIRLNECWFKYKKKLPDVLRGVHLEAYAGEIFCILGGNGTGKSTCLHIMAGIYKPYRGRVEINGKKIHDYKPAKLYQGTISLLPQAPQAMFIENTVEADLVTVLEDKKDTKLLEKVVSLMEIRELLTQHPYDLSGGEQQKVAFAKILLKKPKIILLDEPTKGLDAGFKISFAKILKQLAQEGTAIIMATHDIEFAAEYADRCALFFDGTIISEDNTVDFFSGNNYYTTAANRMIRHLYPKAITCEDVITVCKMNRKIDE